MKKMVKKKTKTRQIIIITASVIFVLFVLLPMLLTIFDSSKYGNVALIPIEGIITGNGGKYMGQATISSKELVEFIDSAAANPQVKVILLEINSPGGSAVASDEIAAAVKNTEKPVISLIREVGASGGYWVASATDQIIAHKMAITGSIGVISSYLEFSGLMEEYGVGYERLVAGKYKDAGVPFRKLKEDEKNILQSKLDKIHDFFIDEIVANRNLEKSQVKEIATGEFYLGIEAINLGLVDQLGDKRVAEEYMKKTYGLDKIDYLLYQKKEGLIDILTGTFSNFYFSMGEGLGSVLVNRDSNIMLLK